MPGPLGRLIIVLALCGANSFAFSAGIANGSPLGDHSLRFASYYFFFAWVDHEMRRSRVFPSHGYMLWLAMAGPLLLPHFLLRTRGPAGIPLAMLLILVLIAPYLAAFLGEMAYPNVPELFRVPEE